MSMRPVRRLIKAKPTLEGAGVHLRRAFGFGNTSDFDPFLLLDDFRNVTGVNSANCSLKRLPNCVTVSSWSRNFKAKSDRGQLCKL